MQENYRRFLARVDRRLRAEMTRYFVECGMVPGDVPGDDLFDVVRRAGLCQADVVLCLLRINSRAALRLAERLVGRCITHCPPCLALFRGPLRVAPRRCAASPDDRRVVATSAPAAVDKRGRRRLLGSPMYARMARVRPGMTLSQVVSRGLTRRDIRIAVKRGYFVMEESA
jgi:hypothetical protein